MRLNKLMVLIPGLTLTACSTSPVEDQFGDSVREMQVGQTLDAAARTNPSDAPVVGADAYVVNAAVDAMRKDGGKREEVKKEVIVNLGAR